jgi:hypothetical protein
LPRRVLGVILSPAMVFRTLAAEPRWAGILVLTVAVAAGASGVLFWTDVGQQALLDQRVDLLEGFGQLVDDERYAWLESDVPSLACEQLAIIVLGLPLLTVALGVGAHVTYGARTAGVTLRHALAVVAHAGAILMVRYLIVSPWNYVRESLGSPLNFGVLFPFLEEGGFAASFLGMLDVFVLWWVLVLATGLGVLYHRSTRSVAATILAVYAGLAVVIAGARSALGGQ